MSYATGLDKDGAHAEIHAIHFDLVEQFCKC